MIRSDFPVVVAFIILVVLYLFRRIRIHQERKVIHFSEYIQMDIDMCAQQAQKSFAEQHGCLPAPRIQNQRPWGVDRLEQIFRGDRESRLMELFLFHFRQTGNTVEQCFIGDIAFDTIDPANLEAILSTRAKDFHFGRRRDITFPLLGDGIFTQEGAAWKHSRELLRAPLQHKHYETLDVFKQSVDDLIEVLSNQTGVVDLQPLFFVLTLDVSSEFLFGESVKSLKAPESATEQTFHGAFSTAQTFLAKRFRLPDLYWLIGGSKFKKACDDVHQFTDQIIDRNLSSPSSEKSSVFIDSLAECTADHDALRGHTINLLAAGRDPTACLLTWTFFLLVRHPRVLEKLREEINANRFDTANLTRTDLRQMGYLQNVLRETLRLYPSVPVNDRKAKKKDIASNRRRTRPNSSGAYT